MESRVLPPHLLFVPLLPPPSDLRHVNDMFLKTLAGSECFQWRCEVEHG